MDDLTRESANIVSIIRCNALQKKAESGKVGLAVSTLITTLEGKISVIFLTKKENITLPRWFCKRCFYRWIPTSEQHPDRCRNVRGYTNEEGQYVPKCGKTFWDSWADDFNPKTCTSQIALQVYYEEKAQLLELSRLKSAS